MKYSILTTLSLLFFIYSGVVNGHESRPAYLEINETQADVFDITWRRPARGEMVLSMQPVFPQHCDIQGSIANYLTSGAHIARWTMTCPDIGLVGQTVSIDGLVKTITDVLVRVQMQDGTVYTKILKPNNPSMEVKGAPSTWGVFTDYLVLGVEHILGGIDHLLFVLCLLLIVKGNWLLVKTITAFTVAHSITLAIATLDIVTVPQAPVEAVIALSIIFLAVELVKQQQGKRDLAIRSPWIVAFIFGLLHGFGFAGALSEVGLPQSDIPLALLSFNLGVEAGQLLFIAVVITVMMLWKHITKIHLAWLPRLAAYSIGSVASFWTIQRLLTF